MAAADRRPTINDVARVAGVSKSTVSLVLRNSPQVREATREQVRAAMVALGYVYNRAAANLRMASTSLIGLVVNDMRNPFFGEYATSLQMALSEQGYAVVLANTDEDPGLQDAVVSAMVEHGVAALVISPAYGGTPFEILERAGIPAMQVFRKVSADVARFPYITPDYATGGRLATEHLLKAGARRIAFVGGQVGRPVTLERMSGYMAVLAEHGVAPLSMLGRASRRFGHDTALRLASEQRDVDAVLCFNDLVALGVVAGCAQIGRPVGSALKVVGFDGIEEGADSWPGLTTIDCDIAGFGRQVAETVAAWLDSGTPPPPVTRRPVRLVVRGSSG
jgi:LacI family transcriptional regulator